MSLMHTEFKDITIHTAKCDTCNKHNTKIMKQCVDCGQNFCTPCWHDRGSDGTHMLNSGDKGYAATNAQFIAKAKRARALDLLKPKKQKISQMKIPTPRLNRRSKRTRRRTVIVEESESEDDGGAPGDQMVLDETTSDEADGSSRLTLEPPRVKAVRRRQRGNVPSPLREIPTIEYAEASTSSTPAVTHSAYHPTTMDDNDAANSLLFLQAGTSGVPLNSFTSVNTSNAYNNIPHSDISGHSAGSRCATVYSPITPPGLNNSTNFSAQQNPSLDGLTKAWASPLINSTYSQASTQSYPYPMNPRVTSTTIGHDSQGNTTLTYQPPHTFSKPHNDPNVSSHQPDNIVKQTAKLNESLFLDPDSDEAVCAVSAGLPKEPAWPLAPAAGNPGLTNEEVDALLKSMEKMEGGMDERGARLFGNEEHGEVWDQQFDESYLPEYEDGVEEHNAGAKANLNFGSRTRAPRPRASRDDEELEEGEIMEDDEDEDMSI